MGHDYYGEVRDILEDWYQQRGVTKADLEKAVADIIKDLEKEEPED